MRGTLLALTTFTLALSFGCGPTVNPGDGEPGDDTSPEIRLPPRSSAGFDCQDIPETGVCRDDVAIYCDRRSSSIVEKRCGARSLSCEVSERGARCVDSEGNEEEVPSEGGQQSSGESCGDLTFDGECDADGNVRYCNFDDTVSVLECSGNGQETCGLDENAGFYDCLPTGCPADLVTEDQCDGDVFRTCHWNSTTEMYEEVTEDCAANSQVCDKDEYGYGACEDPAPPPGPTCEELGAVGACKDATSYHYCIDDEAGIQEFDCSTIGKICGLSGSIYACVDDIGP